MLNKFASNFQKVSDKSLCRDSFQSIFSQAFDFLLHTPVNILITIIILLAAGVMRLVFHTFFLDICCVLKSFMGDWDACNGSV